MLHGSLQFFAFWGAWFFAVLRVWVAHLVSVQFSEVFVNVWTAQFESDSRAPLVDFRDDFGIRESVVYRLFIILGCLMAWGCLSRVWCDDFSKRAIGEPKSLVHQQPW